MLTWIANTEYSVGWISTKLVFLPALAWFSRVPEWKKRCRNLELENFHMLLCLQRCPSLVIYRLSQEIGLKRRFSLRCEWGGHDLGVRFSRASEGFRKLTYTRKWELGHPFLWLVMNMLPIIFIPCWVWFLAMRTTTSMMWHHISLTGYTIL